MKKRQATKTELYAAIDAWETNPNDPYSCDNLCWVCDQLPGQPEGHFSPERLREMVAESEIPD